MPGLGANAGGWNEFTLTNSDSTTLEGVASNISASAASNTLNLPQGLLCQLQYDVTKTAGTNPTLQFEVQTQCNDATGTWQPVFNNYLNGRPVKTPQAFGTANTTGMVQFEWFGGPLRVHWTLGGSASPTYTVNKLRLMAKNFPK